MLARKTVAMIAVLLVGMLIATQSLSQEQQRQQREQRGDGQGQPGQRGDRQGQRGQRGQRGDGQGQRQRDGQRRGQQERRSQRRFDAKRVQERLGATDSECQVLGPRVMKVAELSRQLRPGGRGGRQGGSRDERSDGRREVPGRDRSAIDIAQEQLRTLLDNTSATPDQIRKRVAALRVARRKVQQLVAAQQDLTKVLTVRQEAQLIIMGLLD